MRTLSNPKTEDTRASRDRRSPALPMLVILMSVLICASPLSRSEMAGGANGRGEHSFDRVGFEGPGVPELVARTPAKPDVSTCTTGLRPRVLVLVDTSGSMVEHFTDNNGTGGDGSSLYSDAVMTRSAQSTPGLGLYQGFQIGSPACPAPANTQYDGVNSRLYATKAAYSDYVLRTSDKIDWGLMRYTGTSCPVVGTFTAATPTRTCTTDSGCKIGEFCVGGVCGVDNNLCEADNFGANVEYGLTDRRGGGACGNHEPVPLTYSGSCGTSAAQGSSACATPQVCYSDSDCNGGGQGQCAVLGSGPARSCQGGGSFAACPTGYTAAAGRCVYNIACQNPGGTILADPSAANSAQVLLPYIDGVEATQGNGSGLPVNPELRAVGGTPLAGAARTATAWYQAIRSANLDPQIACRPYVLVLITDGFDTCDTDTIRGPIAAAASFVAATAPGATNLNKVYVIGLAVTNNPSSGGSAEVDALNGIAKSGGTGSAFFANNQAEIEAALSAIAQSILPAGTAASAKISGQVTTSDGQPLDGVTMGLDGTQTTSTITDSSGRFTFASVDTDSFYVLTPHRANYRFSPANRSFSLVANNVDAVFTALADANETANPLDTPEFFVRQHYLDFLSREPDASGFNYWTAAIKQCGSDTSCLRGKRIDVSNAFFYEQEFQETGAYAYRVYKAALGQPPTFAQFQPDRALLVGGANLDQSKSTFALAFVQRDGFVSAYPRTQTALQFVDALLSAVNQDSGVDLTPQRSVLIGLYDGTDKGRAAVLHQLVDNQSFIDAEYNRSFVLMQYFGYLRRDPDQRGLDFWLDQVNSGPLRGLAKQHEMVCSFVTSAEYQQRFSSLVTHSNAECSQ